MRKGMTLLAFFLALLIFAYPVRAVESLTVQPEDMAVTPAAPGATPDGPFGAAAYQAKILFRANGGAGVMAALKVSSDQKEARLTPNGFYREGCTFLGWNTKKDGSGKSYEDQADAMQFVTPQNYKKKVVLYAQWEIAKPKVRQVKRATPGTVKVKFQPVAGADGYEIQYSVNRKFNRDKKIRKKIVEQGVKSAELVNTVPGKTHYVRMRSFSKSGGAPIYSEWTKVTAKTKARLRKVSTISNTKSMMAIEADVALSGTGTGYHAKLVMGTSKSAVSYGIQYDRYAALPYTGRTVPLIENVAGNYSGGQSYFRPSAQSLKQGKSYHLMMTLDRKGRGSVYLNYKKTASFYNPNLAWKKIKASDPITLRVEGSARLNGDTVKAVFSNIRCKVNGKFDENRKWAVGRHITNKTLKIKDRKDGSIALYGKISNLPGGGDWDSRYGEVSAVCVFY